MRKNSSAKKQAFRIFAQRVKKSKTIEKCASFNQGLNEWASPTSYLENSN